MKGKMKTQKYGNCSIETKKILKDGLRQGLKSQSVPISDLYILNEMK